MAVKASGLEILVRFVRVLIRVSNLVLYYKMFIRGLRRLGFGVLFAFFWGSFSLFFGKDSALSGLQDAHGVMSRGFRPVGLRLSGPLLLIFLWPDIS